MLILQHQREKIWQRKISCYLLSISIPIVAVRQSREPGTKGLNQTHSMPNTLVSGHSHLDRCQQHCPWCSLFPVELSIPHDMECRAQRHSLFSVTVIDRLFTLRVWVVQPIHAPRKGCPLMSQLRWEHQFM